MKTTTIQIENLKCGGCASTIKKGLNALESIEQVEVNVEESSVSITTNAINLKEVRDKLSKMGYPEVGDKNTIAHKAKSYVSCAVGRLDS